MAETYTEAAQDERIEELKKRKNKILILLLLLLLLLLLIFSSLAYLFFERPLQRPVKKGQFEFLFSIYGLNRPLATAAGADGNIYVSDTGNARVLAFNSQGRYIRRIGTDTRTGRVYAPYGAYVDNKAGRIYVADFTDRAVHAFNLNGKLLFNFPKKPAAKAYGEDGFTPYGVAEYKNKIYVTSNDGIYIFSKSGKLKDKIMGRGIKPRKGRKIGDFNFPNGIVIDQRNGDIYITDVLNRRVKALNNKGTVRWIVGKPDVKAKIRSFFGLPRGITLDPARNYLYITDTFANRIVVLDTKGRLISIIGERGADDGQFNFPEGITFKDGVFYIADRENNRIEALKVNSYPPPKRDELLKYRKSFIEAKD